MRPTVQLVSGAFIVLMLGGCNAFSTATNPTPQYAPQQAVPHVDEAALAHAFSRQFEHDFRIIKHGFFIDKNQIPWWLVTVRPRRSGQFIVRHTSDLASQALYGGGVHREYFFSVGPRGQTRTHHIHKDWSYTSPLACLGDDVIIPVLVAKDMFNHRFSRASILSPEHAESRRDADKRLADPKTRFPSKITPAMVGAFPAMEGGKVTSDAKWLGLLGSRWYAQVSPGNWTIFIQSEVSLWLVARSAGRFLAILKNSAAKDEQARLSVTVSRAKSPVTETLMRVRIVHFNKTGTAVDVAENLPRPIVVRRGDQIVWTAGDFRSVADPVPPEARRVLLPSLSLEVKSRGKPSD